MATEYSQPGTPRLQVLLGIARAGFEVIPATATVSIFEHEFSGVPPTTPGNRGSYGAYHPQDYPSEVPAATMLTTNPNNNDSVATQLSFEPLPTSQPAYAPGSNVAMGEPSCYEPYVPPLDLGPPAIPLPDPWVHSTTMTPVDEDPVDQLFHGQPSFFWPP